MFSDTSDFTPIQIQTCASVASHQMSAVMGVISEQVSTGGGCWGRVHGAGAALYRGASSVQ